MRGRAGKGKGGEGKGRGRGRGEMGYGDAGSGGGSREGGGIIMKKFLIFSTTGRSEDAEKPIDKDF